MINMHLRKNAIVSVAARPVPREQASAFGVIVSDSENRIIGFEEKPKNPTPMTNDPSRAYVSMGNYIFNTDVLADALMRAQRKRQHDFGAHVIPDLVKTGKVFAYDFETNIIPGTRDFEERGYWRDAGTISAYFDAHMDMLGRSPLLELHNELWPVYPSAYEGPATKMLSAEIKNSEIAEGTIIQDARICNSFIRRGAIIEDNVSIEDCIIMDNTIIRKGCRLKKTIVDKHNVIKKGEKIGFDPEKDRFHCHIDDSGIAIIPRGGRVTKAE
jgi:glucose-1-phosphate adenylyltransferase